MTVQFDHRFEMEILCQAAEDPAYRRKAARILQDHRFSDERFTWMWRSMRDLPASDKFTTKLAALYARKAFKKDDDRRKHLEAVRDVLLELKPEHPGASLDELDAFIRYHRLIGAIKSASEQLQKSDVKAAEELILKAVRTRGECEYDYGDYIEGFEERQNMRAGAAEGSGALLKIPTTVLPSLDKYLEGGIEPGEVGIIVGTTGRGKSIFAANFAFAAAMRGFDTLLISTEMKRALVETRLDARMLHQNYADIKHHRFSEAELDQIQEQYDRMKGPLSGKLRIASTSVRRFTVETLERMISDAREDGMDLKLVVADSGDHLKPKEKTQTRRDRETAAYWDIKSVGEEEGIGFWSTSHAPRDVVDKIATTEKVGETYDKARICDVMISLNQTRIQKEENRMRVFLAKNRQGEGGGFIDVEIDYPRMEIHELAEAA